MNSSNVTNLPVPREGSGGKKPNSGDYLQATIHFDENSGDPLYPGNFTHKDLPSICGRSISQKPPTSDVRLEKMTSPGLYNFFCKYDG